MVDVKCTSCGGVMRLDVTRQAADCPFCGSKMLLDNAALGQLDAASRGDILLELGEYQRAAQAYEEAVSIRPQDYRAWRGRLYLFLARQNADYASVPKDAENMLRLLPPESREPVLADLKQKINAAVVDVRGAVQGFFAFVQQQEQQLGAQYFMPQTQQELMDVQIKKRRWTMSNGSWLVRRGGLLLFGLAILWLYSLAVLLPLALLLTLAFVVLAIIFAVAKNRNDKKAHAAAIAEWYYERSRQWLAMSITNAPQAQPVKKLVQFIPPLAMLCRQCAPEYVPELEKYSQDLLNYNVLGQ